MGFKVIRTEKKVQEFSKKVIVAMVFLWFAGALFGGYITYKDTGNLSYLLDYIGQPVVGGILGYLLKSAFENREKIKNNPRIEEEKEC